MNEQIRRAKHFVRFIVDDVVSCAAEGPSSAWSCEDNTDTADVAPCHTHAAGVCSESSSTDIIYHRIHSDDHLKTEFDSQCTKNSEPPLWIADKYCFLMTTYSKNSVLQTSIKKE